MDEVKIDQLHACGGNARCTTCRVEFLSGDSRSIVRQLESSGETEIPSDMVGGLVMEALASLDQVAYVRFASVYRNFREAKDFGEFIGRIGADSE